MRPGKSYFVYVCVLLKKKVRKALSSGQPIRAPQQWRCLSYHCQSRKLDPTMKNRVTSKMSSEVQVNLATPINLQNSKGCGL